jgi:hypothetical protein
MEFGVPSFWFVSWYDIATSPNIALFNHVRNNAKDLKIRDNQYLIIAPTLHCGFKRATENTIVGELSVGDARLNYDQQVYSFFDLMLKDIDNDFKEETPRVQYYTMGSNKWQNSDQWPPENIEMTNFYLTSNGNANTLNGDGKLTTLKRKVKNNTDSLLYDPMNPVQSVGGGVCCMGNALKGGSFDQQEIELREDVLVYSTDNLKNGFEVTGFINSTIYLSSDVKDTDITIKFIDVYPDGRAFNIDETIQRVRYREGYDKEVMMEKNSVYKVDLTPMSTSYYFKKGHQIRIEVSSSNFPRFARNLNTGGNNYDESISVVANNKIYHSKKYLSLITLPIVKK